MLDFHEGTPLEILLIEDDPEQAALTRKLLERDIAPRPWVQWASDVSIAAQQIHRTAFDVILLDINLSQVSGIYTLLWIAPFVGRVPIIVLSATDNPKIRDAASKIGIRHFLSKDRLANRALDRVIREALRSAEGADPTRATVDREPEAATG